MGNRRMAEIRTINGSIYLYTHWGGDKLPGAAKVAVERAKPRLGEESEWVRIVVDQIFKENRDQEAGAGISLKPNFADEYNDDKPSVIIDAATGKVRVVDTRNEDEGREAEKELA